MSATEYAISPSRLMSRTAPSTSSSRAAASASAERLYGPTTQKPSSTSMSRITMATSASSSTRSTRLPASACDWITMGGLLALQADPPWRSNGPDLSAMGSDSVQSSPSVFQSNTASPPSWLVTEAVMILVPNP